MNIYVGNLSPNTVEGDLRKSFENYGVVDNVKIITDYATGYSKGFAFVEMPDNEHAAEAVKNLNNSNLDGNVLTVNEARPREERGGQGGSSYGNKGGYRSGGGNRGSNNRGGGYGKRW